MSTIHLLQVFLCHASQDKPVVRDIYERLKKEFWINPFLDEISLLPGQNWKLEISKFIRESHIVLVFLSQQTLTREGYLQKEIKEVLDTALEKPPGTIFIIPLRIEECAVPEQLSDRHWQNYFGNEGEKSRGYERLLESLRVRANSVGIKTINKKEKLPLSVNNKSYLSQNKVDRYSPVEICSMFNISKSTIYRWERDGRISPVKRNFDGNREYSKNHIKEIAHLQIEYLTQYYSHAMMDDDIEQMKNIHESFSMIKALYLEDVTGLRELAEYDVLAENTIRQLLRKALTLSVNDLLFHGIISVLNHQVAIKSTTP